MNRLKNDVNEGYNTGRVRVSYGNRTVIGGGNSNVPNCVAINQYNNANFGTDSSRPTLLLSIVAVACMEP